MKKIKVAINGLGRIGRAFLKIAIDNPEIEIVAVNDLGDLENLTYLLQFDSAYGKSGLKIEAGVDSFTVDGKNIKFIQEKDPAKLPWADLGVDVVVEATGFFTKYSDAKAHLDAGARKVVISAPAKGDPVPGIGSATVLMGINEHQLGTCQISSNASCTTNSASPVIQIMNETIGIKKALLNTIHGYTATQSLIDAPNKKDKRKGRAAAVNIIPSTTGAAIATTKAIPELEGVFDGMALRVPVISGSVADITFIAKRDTTVEEINEIFKKAEKEDRWKGIIRTSDEGLVSTDILADPHASIIDMPFTRVVGGNLVKVLAWYDNEMGYTNTLVSHVIKTAKS